MELDWTQALTIIGTNILMLIGTIGLAITIYLKDDEKISQHRKDTNDILKTIKDDMKDFQNSMKDFHGRMCAIEERKKCEK